MSQGKQLTPEFQVIVTKAINGFLDRHGDQAVSIVRSGHHYSDPSKEHPECRFVERLCAEHGYDLLDFIAGVADVAARGQKKGANPVDVEMLRMMERLKKMFT